MLFHSEKFPGGGGGGGWWWWWHCNYRVSSRSRPLEFEIEMEIHMTWETSGVDLDRVWTGA